MFEFSFAEMILAGVVALVVLGPERLPIVARKAGEWVGKIQRLVSNVKSELTQHPEWTELAKVKADFTHTATHLQQDLHDLSQQIATDIPAWERLPEQKTPADFGLDETGQPLSNHLSGSLKNQSWQTPSLRKQALSRKRDMRPRYRPTPKFRSKR